MTMKILRQTKSSRIFTKHQYVKTKIIIKYHITSWWIENKWYAYTDDGSWNVIGNSQN